MSSQIPKQFLKLAFALAGAVLATLACTRSEQVTYTCTSDEQCTSGLCIEGACISRENADIDPIDGVARDRSDDIVEDTGSDASDTDASELPGTLGDPCTTDSDCSGGVCIPFVDTSGGYCSVPCIAECPDDDYVCDALADGRFACTFVGSAECGSGGVCRPGGTMRETAPCGACGEGTFERSRVCDAACRWGAWSEVVACDVTSICAPGAVQTDTELCSACDGSQRSRTRLCDAASCDWAEWSVWGECRAGDGDAGGAALCVPGAEEAETQACGPCNRGAQRRVRLCDATGCGYSEWSEWSDCDGLDDVCEPGVSETESENCGACGTGTRQRQRTCLETCGFAPWSDWGACSAPAAECSAGETQEERRGCGNCNTGSQARTRSCDASTCSWGSWGDWGGCAGGGACSPGATRACEACGVNTCNDSCNWGGACTPRAGAECLWNEGRNWRCCGSGRWQFCLPSTCRWSGDCAPCSGCGC